MYTFSTTAPLILSLLTTQSLAQCGRGTKSGSKTLYARAGACSHPNPNSGLYYCAGKTTVVQKDSSITLRAGAADTTVLLVCGGGAPLLFHCLAGQHQLFSVPQCAGGVGSVENVRETA